VYATALLTLGTLRRGSRQKRQRQKEGQLKKNGNGSKGNRKTENTHGNTADKKHKKTRGRKSVHFNVQHILGTVQDIMKRKPNFLLPNFPVAVLFRLPFSTVAFFQLPFLPLPFLPFTSGVADHLPAASV